MIVGFSIYKTSMTRKCKVKKLSKGLKDLHCWKVVLHSLTKEVVVVVQNGDRATMEGERLWKMVA